MRKRSEKDQPRERREDSAREWIIDVPNDPANEQVVLAAMIVDRDTRLRLLKSLHADMFYAPEHRAIFGAFAELERRKLEYDPATLQRLSPDVDIRILETYAEARPEVAPNLDSHVEWLSWDRVRAQATRGPIASLLEAIQNPKESPERVRAIARQVAEAFGSNGSNRYLRDPKEVVREAMNDLRRRLEGEAFYPFGIDGLDLFENGERRLRPGAAPGLITMVTGVTGSAKSTVTARLTLGLAREIRKNKTRGKILFGAWEVNAPTTIELLAVLSLGWSRSRILDGKSNRIREDVKMTPEEVIELEEREHLISKYVIFFDNPFRRGRNKTNTGRRVTNDDHLDIIAETLADSGCSVFVADLWQRCLKDTKPDDEQEALFRQLAIIEELRTHLVMVHQQRHKDVEQRADRRPTREGVKGSGAWLDVASTVIAPHLPAKWKRIPDDKIQIFILKQRFGAWPLGIEFDWNPEYGSLENGVSISYDQPGETSDAVFDAPRSKRGKR